MLISMYRHIFKLVEQEFLVKQASSSSTYWFLENGSYLKSNIEDATISRIKVRAIDLKFTLLVVKVICLLRMCSWRNSLLPYLTAELNMKGIQFLEFLSDITEAGPLRVFDPNTIYGHTYSWNSDKDVFHDTSPVRFHILSWMNVAGEKLIPLS